MATQDVRLRLLADGSQATRELDRVKRAVGGVAQAAAAAFGLAVGGSIIASFAKIADSAANNAAKIKLATTNSQEFARAQADIFRIAQQTSAGLDDTTALYTKLSASLKDVGVTQGQLATVTQTVNQALLVSGASAASSAGAIQQLGQAFASGTLRGDEFNSVNEAAPRLMRALAESLGVPVGALRKLAEEGKLTSEQLLQAFSGEQAQRIASEAENIPVTIARGFTQIQNAVQQYVGNLDQATGASASFAAQLVVVAQNIAPIAQAAALIAGAGLVLVLGKITAAFVSMASAALASAVAGRAVAASNVLAAEASLGLAVSASNAARSELALAGAEYQQARAAVVAGGSQLALTEASTALALAQTNATKAAIGLAAAQTGVATATAAAAGILQRAATGLVAFAGGPVGAVIVSLAAMAYALKVAYQESQVVRDAFAYMAYGAAEAVTGLRFAVEVSFATIAAVINGSLNTVRGAIVKLLDLAAKAGQLSFFGQQNIFAGQAQEIQKVSDAVRSTITNTEDLKGTISGFNDTREEQRRLNGLVLEQQLLESANYGRIIASAEAAGDAGADAAAKAAAAARAAAEAAARLAGANNSVAESALDKADADEIATRSLEEHQRAMEDAIDGADAFARIQRELAEELGGPGVVANNRYKDTLAAIAEEEIRLLGLGPPTIQQLQDISAARTDAGKVYEQELSRQTEFSQDAASEYERQWDQATSAVSDAFGDFVTGGIKSFKDFGNTLKQIAQRFMADLISQFARKIILNIGVNGSASGGSGGGILSALSSIFGGGSGAPGGGVGANFVGPLQPGAAAGAAGFGGGLSSILSTTAIAAAVYAGGSAIATALGGNAQIGGIFGGLIGGLFGGPAPPDLRLGGVGVTRKPEQTFQTAFGNNQIGVRGGNSADEFKKLVTEFDASLAGIVGSFGNGQDQLDKIKARLATWSIDLKGSAVTAEAVLGSRFTAILSTFSTDIQTFVGSVGTTAERAARLQDAAFIEAAATSGELLGTFTALAGVLTDARKEGENIQATYARVAGATALLDQATALMGVTIEGSRTSFIKAATDIAEAAGGLDRATSLWQTYFETFYTDNERAAQTLAQAQTARDAALTALGVATNVSLADYRAQFEALVPTLTPAQIVQWLEGAASIAAADKAQEAYNQTLGETATAASAAADKLSALESALDALAGIESSIDQGLQELERSGLNDFQRAMLGINDGLLRNVSALQAQRAAAIGAGASSEQLARFDVQLGRAHLLAAQQAAQAINALRGAGRSLVAQLYGQVTGAARQFADSGTSAINEVGDASANLYASQLAAIQGIQQYLDSQLLGNLSALTPQERLDEAQSQFNAALALAQTGDPRALQDVTRLADVLLRERQGRFASAGFREFADAIRAQLQGLLGLGAIRPPQSTGGGGGFGGAINGAVDEFGQQASINRLELAQQLSEIVANLLQATGDSLSAVAASIGLSLSDLVTDLGVNLDALTVASTNSLGTIANSLGVELSELATNVGAELGALSTDQSLINAALEAEIAKLPVDQAAQLQPLLDAVEQAALTGGPAKVNAAIDLLEQATREIGGDAAFRLAPYLDDIDPTDPLRDIDSVLRSELGDANLTLSSILDALMFGPTAGPGSPGLPANPGGGGGLPSSIVTGAGLPAPPATAAALRQAESGNAALLAELKRVTTRLESLERTVKSGDRSNVDATSESAEKQAAAIDRQTVKSKGGRLVMSS